MSQQFTFVLSPTFTATIYADNAIQAQMRMARMLGLKYNDPPPIPVVAIEANRVLLPASDCCGNCYSLRCARSETTPSGIWRTLCENCGKWTEHKEWGGYSEVQDTKGKAE